MHLLPLKIKALFFSTLLCFSIPQICADDSQEIKEQQVEPSEAVVREKIQDEFAQLKKQLTNNLFTLDNILQQLSLDINQHNIKTDDKVDLEHRINTILHCKKEIASYLRTLQGMVVPDPSKISEIVSFINEFTVYLENTIQKGFKDVALFRKNESRHPLDAEIEFEKLQSQIESYETKLATLKVKSDNLIYPWYSKVFRGIAKGEPHVRKVLSYSPLLVAAAYGLYISNIEASWFRDIRILPSSCKNLLKQIPLLGQYLVGFLENKIPFLEKRLVGWSTPSIEKVAKNVLNDHQVAFFENRGYSHEALEKIKSFGWGELKTEIEKICPKGLIGNISDTVNTAAQDHFGMLLLTSIAVRPKLKALTAELANLFHRKYSSCSNWLKGGYYNQQEQEKSSKEITFDNVQGNDVIKEKLRLNILKFIEDPERFMRQGIAPERGWLFTGPPGTGKTLMAKALGGEIRKKLKELGKENKLGFKYWSSSQVARFGIDSIVEYMQDYAPCVIFIDELDLLHLQRVGNSDLLATFLTTLDGCASDPDKPVWVLAATNQPQNIDPALKRAGRLNNIVPFGIPTLQDRREFLYKLLHNMAIDTTNINIDKLAYESDGHLFKDLESMVERAIYIASIKGNTIIDQALLEEAFNAEIRKILPVDNDLSLQEKEISAVQQIGIALAHFLLQSRSIVSHVTIKPIVAQLKEETQWEKYHQEEDKKQKEVIHGQVFTFLPENSIGIETSQDKVNQCKILLAANIAEKIVYGSCGYSYRPENKYNAFKLAREMACEGIHFNLLSDELKGKVTNQAWETIKTYEEELTTLFTQFKPYLTLLAMTLLLQEEIDRAQIVRILNLDKEEVEKILSELQNPVQDPSESIEIEDKEGMSHLHEA